MYITKKLRLNSFQDVRIPSSSELCKRLGFRPQGLFTNDSDNFGEVIRSKSKLESVADIVSNSMTMDFDTISETDGNTDFSADGETSRRGESGEDEPPYEEKSE